MKISKAAKIIILLSALLNSSYLYSEKLTLLLNESDDYIRFYTTNNINIKGKTAEYYGDNFNTGTLLLEMKKDNYFYGVNLSLYTQVYKEYSDIRRVDVLELYFGKLLDFKYLSNDTKLNIYGFGQFTGSGNFGGEELQKIVHNVTSNKQDILPYSCDHHMTLGITFEADLLHSIDDYRYAFVDAGGSINLDGSGYLELNSGNIYKYETMQFKIYIGARYISPLKQELVEESTVNRWPVYAIAEFGINLWDRATLLIGSKVLGDNIYGNESDNPYRQGRQKVKDPYTYMNIFYTF